MNGYSRGERVREAFVTVNGIEPRYGGQTIRIPLRMPASVVPHTDRTPPISSRVPYAAFCAGEWYDKKWGHAVLLWRLVEVDCD